MHIRTVTAVFAAVLPFASLATGFGPGDECRQVGEVGGQPAEVCTLDTFMLCPDTVPMQKVHLNAVEGTVELSTDAPAASVSDGAGCGHEPEPFTNDLPTEEEFVVTGSYAGNVDSVSVAIHLLGPGIGHAGEAVRIPATLSVGDAVFEQEFVGVPTVSDTNASARVVIEFTDLGLVTESGAGSTTRDVTLELGAATVPDACDPSGTTSGCLIAGPYPYVWGTIEVPSGLTFNGTR